MNIFLFIYEESLKLENIAFYLRSSDILPTLCSVIPRSPCPKDKLRG